MFNEPFHCMNFFAEHQPIPDGDGLIVELGAQNSCGNIEKIPTHKHTPSFTGWEVGTDIHLMKDLLESWQESFQESYRFSQYFDRDLVSVEFDSRSKVYLDLDADTQSFRARADFEITYGRNQFMMENVDFMFKPVFSNAQFFKFMLTAIDVTEDKVRVDSRSSTSSREARDWIENLEE